MDIKREDVGRSWTEVYGRVYSPEIGNSTDLPELLTQFALHWYREGMKDAAKHVDVGFTRPGKEFAEAIRKAASAAKVEG